MYCTIPHITRNCKLIKLHDYSENFGICFNTKNKYPPVLDSILKKGH